VDATSCARRRQPFKREGRIADDRRVARPRLAEAGPKPPAAPARKVTRPLIQLSTRCATPEDFIEKFAPFVATDMIAIPASGELAVGSEARSLIRLADHTVAMQGRCRIAEVKPTGAPGGRVMMRVQLLETDDATRELHRRLLARRSATVQPPSPPPPAAPV